MRGKGINYDTGFMPGNHTRPDFDPAVVAAEIRVIARELGCTAIRISGGEPDRISVAAEAAAAEGLEVWFSPFPCEVPAANLVDLFRDCADRAEHLRRDGAEVVLVIGCELTLFNPGYLPGTHFYDRIGGWPGRAPGSSPRSPGCRSGLTPSWVRRPRPPAAGSAAR